MHGVRTLYPSAQSSLSVLASMPGNCNKKNIDLGIVVAASTGLSH
jgi:hypothetical protein